MYIHTYTRDVYAFKRLQFFFLSFFCVCNIKLLYYYCMFNCYCRTWARNKTGLGNRPRPKRYDLFAHNLFVKPNPVSPTLISLIIIHPRHHTSPRRHTSSGWQTLPVCVFNLLDVLMDLVLCPPHSDCL